MNEELKKLRELAGYLNNPGENGRDWMWQEFAGDFVALFEHLDYHLSNGSKELPKDWQKK